MGDIFNHDVKILHRNRVAINFSRSDLSRSDFLIKESSQNIVDIIQNEIKIDFHDVLDIGCRDGSYIAPLLREKMAIQNITQCDLSPKMLRNVSGGILLSGEELHFKAQEFDLITNVLNMHWVNNLPQYLLNIHKCLKDKGFFIASIFGGDTLIELRKVMYDVYMEQFGGVSARMAPSIHVKDMGRLLQNAGFYIPVVNSQKFTVMYSDVRDVIRDLRNMGEINALINGTKTFMSRTTLDAINDKYISEFSNSEFSNQDRAIPVTFEVITMAGWKN